MFLVLTIFTDDSTIASSKSEKLSHCFTVSRHYRCSIFLFWHVLFCGTPQSRIISQNSSYFFLLNSPRMSHQIANFGGQLNLRKQLVAAYAETTKTMFGYVLVDVNVKTPSFLRIRTNVFHQEGNVQVVYVPSM